MVEQEYIYGRTTWICEFWYGDPKFGPVKNGIPEFAGPLW
jgi:hypothetical protein